MREGDHFAVPLPGGGWGTGVAARRGKRGVVLGYFSGRRFGSLPTVAEAAFSAQEAVWVALFGDLGVIEGRWRVLGPPANWVPDEWPLPDFGRFAEFSGRHYRVSYNGDLRSRPTEILSTADEIAALPKDGLAGAGFVELKLDRILV
jgi:hypothetical protein